MNDSTLAFVGGGNMARCLVGGAIDAGVPGTNIRVGDPSADQRERLAADFGIQCTEDNEAAVRGADVVVVAVKPQAAAAAAATFRGALRDGAVVVSVMAGIRAGHLRRWLGDRVHLVRAMPNTPALIGQGITALHAPAGTPSGAREAAAWLLGTAGEVVWIDDEALMDAVTAVSGSGPAYAFLLIEALAAAGVREGLAERDARTLAAHTLRGAAEMAIRTGQDPAELRRQVTSPGGTTAAAVAALERAGVRDAFAQAVAAATARGRELAEEFGGSE